MIWIVSGPSSAGKSTFIASPHCAVVTGLPNDTPVLIPIGSSRLLETIDRDCLVHYNILRSADRQRRGLGRAIPASATIDPFDFRQDPVWKELISSPVPKTAVVLVVDATILAARARQRSFAENRLLEGSSITYPSERWLSLCRSVNFLQLYEAWCAELQEHGIGYRLLDARTERYVEVTIEGLPRLLDPERT